MCLNVLPAEGCPVRTAPVTCDHLSHCPRLGALLLAHSLRTLRRLHLFGGHGPIFTSGTAAFSAAAAGSGAAFLVGTNCAVGFGSSAAARMQLAGGQRPDRRDQGSNPQSGQDLLELFWTHRNAPLPESAASEGEDGMQEPPVTVNALNLS